MRSMLDMNGFMGLIFIIVCKSRACRVANV